MPTGIKGFQKGHVIFPGVEQGWFPRGNVPIGGLETRFRSGPDHPRWKGLITGLRNRIRNCARYDRWRADIFYF